MLHVMTCMYYVLYICSLHVCVMYVLRIAYCLCDEGKDAYLHWVYGKVTLVDLDSKLCGMQYNIALCLP